MKTPGYVCALSAWLALVNIGAIIAGFVVYDMLGRTHQLSIQIPVASVGTIVAFAVSAWAIRSYVGEFGRSVRAALGVYVLAFVWAPAIFVPLHLLTQGYVTGWSNIVNLVLFQLPVNLIAVLVAHAVIRHLPAEIRPTSH